MITVGLLKTSANEAHPICLHEGQLVVYNKEISAFDVLSNKADVLGLPEESYDPLIRQKLKQAMAIHVLTETNPSIHLYTKNKDGLGRIKCYYIDKRLGAFSPRLNPNNIISAAMDIIETDEIRAELRNMLRLATEGAEEGFTGAELIGEYHSFYL